jgi:outer membrane protein assembly factor BamB
MSRSTDGCPSCLCRCLAVLSLVLAPAPSGLAGDWPQFRGPNGLGVTDERGLPLTWGGKANANVLWKVPLRGRSRSSPIVCGGRVFVTSVLWPPGVPEIHLPEHHVVCYRAEDGKQLWDSVIPPGPLVLTDLRGGYAAPSPAADGERVYALFGSAVLAALDRDGKPVWRKELPRPYHFDVAIASSPVLYKDTLILLCDETGGASRLLAIDRKTGDVRWDVKRPGVGFDHSTPALAEVGNRPQLLVSAANALQGIDPDTGEQIWWCAASGDVASPAFGNNLVYCDSGRGGGPGVAVEATGRGDVTKTHVKWKVRNVPEGFASPLIVDGRVYRLVQPGVLHCWDAATGKELYAERLDGVGLRPSPFVTPEGHLYFAGAGRSYVIQAGPRFEVLAVNDLGDPGDATAAVAGGRIFLKGERFLFCVGKQ